MRVRYMGIFDSVIVPALSGSPVDRGSELEVSAELGAELLTQSGVWESVAEAPSRPVKETKSTPQPSAADEEI